MPPWLKRLPRSQTITRSRLTDFSFVQIDTPVPSDRHADTGIAG
jgi:hypothetical protein